MSALEAYAKAHANIALSKYWGKSDLDLNLPAVPSISMTLDGLVTETWVRFDETLKEDQVSLDGSSVEGRPKARVIELLNRIRTRADFDLFARVKSQNAFPTAAGLASSACGFAALAGAATAAAGLTLAPQEISALARRSSASAARSVFGGFAELPAGEIGDDSLAAHPLFPADHWALRMVVALTASGPKEVGSTQGMERSRLTSPLYRAWVEAAPSLNKKVREALERRQLDDLGPAMEMSTHSFHACTMSASPPFFYWRPETLSVLSEVHRMRADGLSAWATMDAGPHVKVLCSEAEAATVHSRLDALPAVKSTLLCGPGGEMKVER